MKIKNFLSANKNFDKKDLEIFLMKVLNCDENFLFLNENFSISEEKIFELEKFLEEKEVGYSVASIIGEKDFYGRTFFIDKNVLVPREETEDLISYVKGKILNLETGLDTKRDRSQLDKTRPVSVLGGRSLVGKNILDIGTGSGIIPITLSLELNSGNFFACDISKKALKVAEKNSEIFGTKINFFQSDLLKNLPKKLKEEGIFLITANLPYVEEFIKTDKADKINGISKEPDLALYSGKDGLNHYRELFEELKTVNFKYLIMEMASWQCEEIAKIFSHFGHVEIYKDLGGNDRGVFVEKFS